MGTGRAQAHGRYDAAARRRAAADARARRRRSSAWLEGELDRAAAATPNPGRTVPLHRLNRAEYRNAVRDLLAVDIDVAEPAAGRRGELRLRQHRRRVEAVADAARALPRAPRDKVSRLAVGTPAPFATVDTFRVPDDRSQERASARACRSARAAASRIDYTFPHDGEYAISAELARDLNEGMPVYLERPGARDQRRRRARRDVHARRGRPRRRRDRRASRRLRPAGETPPRRRLPRASSAQRNRADEDWEVRVPVKAGRARGRGHVPRQSGALQRTAARAVSSARIPRGLNIPEGALRARICAASRSAGRTTPTGPGDTASRDANLHRAGLRRDERDATTGDAEDCAQDDSRGAGAPRVPPPGRGRRRCAAARRSTRRARRRRRLRRRHPAGAASACS